MQLTDAMRYSPNSALDSHLREFVDWGIVRGELGELDHKTCKSFDDFRVYQDTKDSPEDGHCATEQVASLNIYT